MKSKIQQLITQAKTEAAVKLLLEYTKGDSDLHNSAIQLSARFQTYKKNLLGNLESPAVLGVEIANIHRSLLALAEELETSSAAAASPPAVPPKVWLRWIGIAVAVCAFLASVAELTGYSLRDVFSQKKQMADTAITQTTLPKDTVAKLPVHLPVETSEASTQPPKPVPTKPTSSTVPSTTSRGNIPDSPPPPAAKELKISIKTAQSTAAEQSYRAGESLRLYVQATQPCYVRALYKLADGQVVLLAEDKEVKEKDIANWIELGYGFEVSEPLGEEALHVFAQTQPFDDLKTVEKDGYRYVLNGLSKILDATRRGLKPQALHTESLLKIRTYAK